MKVGMLVPITDTTELQNLLDDFSPLRPELNVYEIDGDVWANSEQLHTWHTNHDCRVSREEAKKRAQDEVRAREETYA